MHPFCLIPRLGELGRLRGTWRSGAQPSCRWSKRSSELVCGKLSVCKLKRAWNGWLSWCGDEAHTFIQSHTAIYISCIQASAHIQHCLFNHIPTHPRPMQPWSRGPATSWVERGVMCDNRRRVALYEQPKVCSERVRDQDDVRVLKAAKHRNCLGKRHVLRARVG